MRDCKPVYAGTGAIVSTEARGCRDSAELSLPDDGFLLGIFLSRAVEWLAMN
jgi:hypothetical protein